MSNVVDWSDETKNMYGCSACPKCESKFRVAYKRPAGLTIECDECGYKELAVEKDEENE